MDATAVKPADPATTALASAASAPAPLATVTNAAGGGAQTASTGAAPTAAPAIALSSVPAYNYSNDVSSGQASQDLTNFQTNAKSAVDIYNEATTKLGIPDVRTNVTNLRKQIADTTALLNALPDSVTGRTSGSLVTEAQRSRILGAERAPLDQANAQYSNNYNMESQNLNDLTSQATQQSQLYQSDQDRVAQALSTRYTNIKAAEDERARQLEAARQYDLQIKALNQQIADAQRQYDLAQRSLAASSAQASASLAESQRQFNVSTAQSQAKTYNDKSPQQWVSVLEKQYAAGKYPGAQSWGSVAKAIEKSTGNKIPTGSTLDQALHMIYA